LPLCLEFAGKESIDVNRLGSFSKYGFIISGPMLYSIYNKILPQVAPGTSFTSLAKKLILTQTVFAAISIGAFYTAIPLLEGKNPTEGLKEI
jgi:hypothetical protein